MATTLKKVAEFLVGTPDVPTTEERARAARAAVIEAAVAVEAAKLALVAADESGDPAAIQKAEAGIVAAERAADRATRGLEVAERRLRQAQDAAGAAARAEGVKALKLATERHSKVAAAAQRAIDALAGAVAELDQADTVIAEMQRVGVASTNAVPGHNYGQAASRRRIELCLMAAGVLQQGKPLHDPELLSEWSASLETLVQVVNRP